MAPTAISEELTRAVDGVIEAVDEALLGWPASQAPPHIASVHAHRSSVMDFLKRKTAEAPEDTRIHFAHSLVTEAQTILPKQGAGSAKFRAARQAVDRLDEVVDRYLAQLPERVADQVAAAVVEALRSRLLPSIETAVVDAVEAALEPPPTPPPTPPPALVPAVTLDKLASFSPADYPTAAAQNALLQGALVAVGAASAKGTLSATTAGAIRRRFDVAAFSRTRGDTWAEVVTRAGLQAQLNEMLDKAGTR